MKKITIYFSISFFILFSVTSIFAEEKSITNTVSNDVKEVKNELVKTKNETKDAIVRDAKAIKGQVPNDLKEAKKEAIKKADYIKTGVNNELKEARENLKKPLKPATSEKKAE